MPETADEDADRAHRAAQYAPYRAHMVSADQKSQEDFDKTVLSLSGGALGISFVFLKDVIGPNPVASPSLLFSAWIAWGMSALSVLVSYYLSHLAIRKIIRQIDTDKLHIERPGGWLRDATPIFNAAGAILFLAGVICITFFANANLKEGKKTNVRYEATTTAPPAATTAPPAAATSATARTAADKR